MLYAETPRLRLRSLEKSDLPRLAELIGDWDVARWLAAVPFPYNLSDAEQFYEILQNHGMVRWPEFYVLTLKEDDAIMGAVGMRKSREANPPPGERILGYWLGKPYWGQGFMSEAVTVVIDRAFREPDVHFLSSSTDPENRASQNVLRKAGFTELGLRPNREPALRGGPEKIFWELRHENHKGSI